MAIAKTLDPAPATARPPPRIVTLAIFLGTALVSAQLICGGLTWLVGPLEPWVWLGVNAAQVIPALFLAGALYAAGEPAERRRRVGDCL